MQLKKQFSQFRVLIVDSRDPSNGKVTTMLVDRFLKNNGVTPTEPAVCVATVPECTKIVKEHPKVHCVILLEYDTLNGNIEDPHVVKEIEDLAHKNVQIHVSTTWAGLSNIREKLSDLVTRVDDKSQLMQVTLPEILKAMKKD